MDNEKIKYLAKNTFVFAIGNIGTKLISFFLVPIYTGVLLASEYGTVDLVITLGSFVVPILICNINEAVMRFALDKDADQTSIMSVGILFIGVLTALSFFVYPLVKLYAPLADYAKLICLYFWTSGCSIILLYNLRGKELLYQFSVGSIIQALSIAVFNIIFLLQFKLGIQGFLFAYCLANLITAVYAFFAGNVIVVIKRFRFDRRLLEAMLKYSVVLIPNSFMWWIMDSSNRLMLTSMVGIASSGLYAVANKLPSLVSTMSSIFNQAWNYSAIKENESKSNMDFTSTVFSGLLGFVAFAGAFLLLFLKPILSVYVDESYYIAWTISPPLIVGTGFLVLATFFSSQYTVHKDSKAFLFSASFGAVMNILLNIVLIPIWQEFGAAMATCISYIAVFGYRIIDIRRYIQIKVFTKRNTIQLCLLICVAVCIYHGILGVIIAAIATFVITIINMSVFIPIIRSILTRRGIGK